MAVVNGLPDLKAAAAGVGIDVVRPLRPDDLALTCLLVRYDPGADEWVEYLPSGLNQAGLIFFDRKVRSELPEDALVDVCSIVDYSVYLSCR